jgi:acetoin utilization deacetylase AcuC-like enzyme
MVVFIMSIFHERPHFFYFFITGGSMNVFFSTDFYRVYTSDPAAAAGRLEAVVDVISAHVDFIACTPADNENLLAVHSSNHVERVRREGLHEIAALAAGGAIQAALAGLKSPSFALIRPPGHHASANSCWGFCFFNNMAVSLYYLKNKGLIDTAFVLDFDLHYGDGNVNILGDHRWIDVLNPESPDRRAYLEEVQQALMVTSADVIAVSAGFDNHRQDWGGLLTTNDYRTMGSWVYQAASKNKGGCYGILEGGYNHEVLGKNVLAFLQGLGGDA